MLFADAADGGVWRFEMPRVGEPPITERTLLSDGIDGHQLHQQLTNDVVVVGDDHVMFSNSGTLDYTRARSIFIRNQRDGTLWSVNARNDGNDGGGGGANVTSLVLAGLAFANGVALAHDGQSVLVTETSSYALRRYWLRGARAGTADV